MSISNEKCNFVSDKDVSLIPMPFCGAASCVWNMLKNESKSTIYKIFLLDEHVQRGSCKLKI